MFDFNNKHRKDCNMLLYIEIKIMKVAIVMLYIILNLSKMPLL